MLLGPNGDLALVHIFRVIINRVCVFVVFFVRPKDLSKAPDKFGVKVPERHHLFSTSHNHIFTRLIDFRPLFKNT